MRTIFLALILIASISFGQGVSQISGTVQDSSGLAIPGAEVRATQTDTGVTRTAVSAADGGYLLPSLPIGPYRLEVSKQGFTSYVQSGITLQVATNPTIDISLKVGAVSEQVQVEASAAMVETQSTGVGQIVDQQRHVHNVLPEGVKSRVVQHRAAAVRNGFANDAQHTSCGTLCAMAC